MKKYKERLVHGTIGGIIVVSLLLVLLFIFKCYGYSPIYILNNDKLDELSLFMGSDSISMMKIETIKELEAKGILLTPQEYTSNISSYYNALITFLIALFIVFSFIGYFSIRMASKRDIQDKLDDMLDDSIKFRQGTVNSVIAVISDTFATKEEHNNSLESIRNDVEASLDEIREQINNNEPSDEEVVLPE